MRIVTALTAAGLTAGLVVTGVTYAGADQLAAGGAPASSARTLADRPSDGSADGAITLPEGGVLENRLRHFCTKAPALVKRAGEAEARINGDAEAWGSPAWLKAKRAQAAEADLDRVVRRLDRRIERRTERAEHLPERIEKLTAAEQECQELGLTGSST